MQVGLKMLKIGENMENVLPYQEMQISSHWENPADTQYIMSIDQNPTEVTQVTSEKDLGVIFDENLIFRDHISKRAALANRNLGLIFRSLTYNDKVMFLNLYKSLIRPHLGYATSVWSPMYKKNSITLEKAQLGQLTLRSHL